MHIARQSRAPRGAPLLCVPLSRAGDTWGTQVERCAQHLKVRWVQYARTWRDHW
ncbi:hypothetical protein BU14_1524s0004 [Porphyra umbilicalis]|uniref:Uncharacterized protein n=1 Tax=Porphyra umbilicalis TaxID=2786 RepID=A0A1X6NLM0_PORUM|nr:hypothetical protein BU14_1524s0004 [Porphyra umbilicalis]|eukprot:OSX69430.1 hypothetical protein BU14_1524s0004 [Porphyra umbilicalis]